MGIKRNCVLMLIYESLDELMLWCQLVWFVFQCWLMKVQGCMMLTLTCKNVIWQHVECQHMRMWDVNMWNVDMWECEMLICESMRIYFVSFPWIWEYISSSQHPMDLRTCSAWCQLWGQWCWLYKVFENVHWCWHRECALCMTGWQVHMSLRMHMNCIWLDVGYAWTCIHACTKHRHLHVDLWTCAAYVQMLSIQELGTMLAIEEENNVNNNVDVPEY